MVTLCLAHMPVNFAIDHVCCVGWNIDVCWNVAVLRQLLLPCTDRQYCNKKSYSVRWHVTDGSMGVNYPLNQNLHCRCDLVST